MSVETCLVKVSILADLLCFTVNFPDCVGTLLIDFTAWRMFQFTRSLGSYDTGGIIESIYQIAKAQKKHTHRMYRVTGWMYHILEATFADIQLYRTLNRFFFSRFR